MTWWPKKKKRKGDEVVDEFRIRAPSYEALKGREATVTCDDGTVKKIIIARALVSLSAPVNLELRDAEQNAYVVHSLRLFSELNGEPEPTAEELAEFDALFAEMKVDVKPKSAGQAREWLRNPMAKVKDITGIDMQADIEKAREALNGKEKTEN